MAKVTIANLNTLLDSVVTGNIAVQTAQSAVTNATIQAGIAATNAAASALSKSQIDQQVIVADGLAEAIDADRLSIIALKDVITALEVAIAANADQVTLDKATITTMLGAVLTAKSGVDVKAELIEELVEDFHTKYLGSSMTEPTVSWGGMELSTGMMYFDTVKGRLMIWLDSNKWEPANEVIGALLAANNLSDLTDKAVARTNLDVMSASEVEAQIQADITAIKGQPLGLAELDAAGLVPTTQLPSYVDDVVEVATKAALPATGESGKIYVVIADETSNGDTSSYRWTGTIYAMVSNTLTAADIKSLYESNLDTNAYTDAEQVKIGYITVTQAVDLDTIESDTALNNTHRTSNGTDHTYIDQDVTTTATPTFAGLVTAGLVDGRDVSVDGLKLDGIEAGATADQTKLEIDALGIDAATVNGLTVKTAVPVGALFTDTIYTDAEIKTKYENNLDTNAFTDAEKTQLANQSGVNTGDQDLSGKADVATTLAGYGITDAYTKTELNAVNVLRADKYLAAQNIANMIYTTGNLTKIQYNTATDVNYEVLTYGVDGLSNIAHYIDSVLIGNTVLTYTTGDLVSAVYTGV